jgi:hypothetical protein
VPVARVMCVVAQQCYWAVAVVAVCQYFHPFSPVEVLSEVDVSSSCPWSPLGARHAVLIAGVATPAHGLEGCPQTGRLLHMQRG